MFGQRGRGGAEYREWREEKMTRHKDSKSGRGRGAVWYGRGGSGFR